jgi:hypothetical protein
MFPSLGGRANHGAADRPQSAPNEARATLPPLSNKTYQSFTHPAHDLTA